MEDKKLSQKGCFIGLIGLIAMVLVSNLIQVLFHTMSPPHVDDYYQQGRMTDGMINVKLMEAADSMNKLMPMYVDSFTEYTSVQSLPNKVVEYNVKLNIDTSHYDMRKVKKALDSVFLLKIITSDNLKSLRDYYVSFDYHFFDKNGHSMFILNFPPDRYNSLNLIH
jgi:hypothetical protein